LIKSYVLKDLFKANENTSKAENYRAESVQSFLKARELDKDKKEWGQINQNLKYLGSKYFNEARANIDTLNHLKAVQLFDEYERVYLFADTAFSSKTKELEFYLALASVFQQCFDNNSSKNCLDYAKVYLQKAMDIDPSSTSAIKNMGILYYNQGVNLIKRMEYDISLEELSNFQDQSIKLFHQAEPFLLKAFYISPTDKTVLEGLQGIYFQLSDFDKSNDFKSKLEALNK
jgi:tetratricopeptide (TPR) repeat protein